MGKWITLQEASRKFGLPKHELLRLIEKNEITALKKDYYWMIDSNDLSVYLAAKKMFNDSLDEIGKDAAVESLMPEKLDEEFILSAIRDLSPTFLLIIKEMATLIPDALKRAVFIDITIGKSFKEVSHTYNIPNIKARYLYRASIHILEKKTAFLKELRTGYGELLRYNRKLEIERENILRKNNELSAALNDKIRRVSENVDFIPMEVAQILSMNLQRDFKFSTRTNNCLNASKLVTVEDLLRYTKTHGFEKLMEIKNFGRTCFNEITGQLKKKKIINKKLGSPYYDYLN